MASMWRISANEQTIPRLHLWGTLLIVLALTLALGSYFLWAGSVEHRESLQRVADNMREQQHARLQAEMDSAVGYLEFNRQRTEAVLRERLREQVDTAMQVAQAIHDQEIARRPASEVKRLIVEALRPVRFFDGRGYYFIDDMQGQFILLPTSPRLEGTTNLDNQDDTGHNIMRGLIAAGRLPEGQGYSRYRWYPPDNPQQMADKLAYVRHFAPFDWIIGTGDYTHHWEQLQKSVVVARLRELRFGQTGYIGLLDRDGTSLLSHSDVSLEGKRVEQMPAAQAKALQRLVDKAAQGGGYVDYNWPDASLGMTVPKAALVHTVQPWGWVLIATMQDNELQSALQHELALEGRDDQRRWRELLVALVLALALGAAVSLAFGRWTRFLFLRYQHNTARNHQVIRDSEALLRAVFDNAAVGIAQLDTHGRFLKVNPYLARFLEQDAQAMVAQGATFMQFTPAGDLPASQAAVRRLLEGEVSHVTLDKRYVTARGDQVWGSVALHLVRDARGQPAYFIAAVHDITANKQAEAQLKLAAGVFIHAREGIMITEVDGTIVDVNAAFTEITGYTREEAVGQNPRILSSHLHTPQEFQSMWSTLISTGQWYGEVWNRRKNGEVFAEMQTISAVRDEAGVTQNYVALFSDITAIKEHQRQLEHIAHFDVLTGLPNRVLLADRLQQAMYQCQRRRVSLAVVYLDLDGFKAVNDAHGHDAGDELLRVLSQRMKDALRGSDTLARVGGDEFVAVLVDLGNAADSEPLLVRLLQAASSPAEVTGTTGAVVLQVSASAGVTLYPDDNTDADLLMRHADQAMYAAKQAGKNRYHLFDLAQDAAIQIQRETIDHIHTALLRQEFVLFYQPKINMRTGQVTGAEALIRWQHPERGLLAPSAFLPVIESDSLSIEMGEWVVRTALDQMKAWHQQGLDLPVSVNIGAHQLQQAGFTERLSQLLAEHPGVDPRTLQLEVLETSALEDMVHVSRVMRDCHSLGVSFALDDFGTGYSSLTYLKRLPAETLKIDQSFVRDMLDDTSDMAIVSGVIGLAKAFGREVIAEGVESAAHGRELLTMGCELAQGYGIARPMPAADVPGWVVRWSAEATWTA